MKSNKELQEKYEGVKEVIPNIKSLDSTIEQFKLASNSMPSESLLAFMTIHLQGDLHDKTY